MTTLDDLLEKAAKRHEQLKNRKRLQEQAAKARERKAKKREQSKTLAQFSREADAHRKILLGGLVIASGVDDWNEGEIVGALLLARERLTQNGALREQLKEKGIAHLEARKAARTK